VLDDDSAAEPGDVLGEMLVDPGLRGIGDRPEQEDRAVLNGFPKLSTTSRSFEFPFDVTA